MTSWRDSFSSKFKCVLKILKLSCLRFFFFKMVDNVLASEHAQCMGHLTLQKKAIE